MNEAKHRSDWIVVRHEVLCADPLKGFGELCSRLGLAFTSNVQQAVIRHSSGSADGENHLPAVQHHHIRNSSSVPDQWRSILSPQQIRRVKSIVGDLGEELYPDSYW
jgi:hypothetical protein